MIMKIDVFTNPINQTLAKIAVLCLGCTGAAFAQHTQDELKQRVLAQAQNAGADDYAFTPTIRTEQTSGGKTEKKVTVKTFDPTKPAEARSRLISVDGAPPPADALKSFRTDSAKRQ
jgi:hypothetical protein